MFIKFNFLCAQVSSSGFIYGIVDCIVVVVFIKQSVHFAIINFMSKIMQRRIVLPVW